MSMPYATAYELNILEKQLTEKIKEAAINGVDTNPTKLSELQNDVGYITNSALAAYARKVEIPTRVSQLQNDSKFITNAALNDYAKTSDLSTFATKAEVNAVVTNIPSIDGLATESQLNEVKNSIPTDYITSATAANFALKSEIPDVSDFVTTSQLNEVDAKIPTDYVTTSTIANYALKTEIPDVSEFVTTTQLEAVEANIPTDVVTSAQLNNVEEKIPTDYLTQASLANYALNSDLEKLKKIYIIDLDNTDEAKAIHLEIVDKYLPLVQTEERVAINDVFVKNKRVIGLVGASNLIPITGARLKQGTVHLFIDFPVQLQTTDNPSSTNFGTVEVYFDGEGNAQAMTANSLIDSGGYILTYNNGGIKAKASLNLSDDGSIALIGHDDSHVISRVNLQDTYALKSELPDISGLATEAQVNAVAANIPTDYVPNSQLNTLATKEEVDTKQDKIVEISGTFGTDGTGEKKVSGEFTETEGGQALALNFYNLGTPTFINFNLMSYTKKIYTAEELYAWFGVADAA